jgi:hypothetical protein
MELISNLKIQKQDYLYQKKYESKVKIVVSQD